MIESGLLTHESDVNFPLNILPFRYGAQPGKQLVELRFLSRLVLEPGKEIERLILREISAVVQPSRQLRKVN